MITGKAQVQEVQGMVIEITLSATLRDWDILRNAIENNGHPQCEFSTVIAKALRNVFKREEIRLIPGEDSTQ